MTIEKNGTQTFSCKIPKYYLTHNHNEKAINPRWQDIENGVLAENTRVLKVSIQFSDTEAKIYPFIIEKIVNKRDTDFSVYKEINATGLAFAELGKIGYKLELNNTILENDFSKDPTTLATIDYWLDKVFPNEKDENGVITKWLTPWSYEIRMDWSGYFDELSDSFVDGGTASQIDGYNFYTGKDATSIDKDKNWIEINSGTSGPLYANRDETKIYEKPYIANWDVINNKLSPISIENFLEKARYVECINSNKYNITQTLAETFEVFCTYEYSCDQNGYFRKLYYDEYGQLWTGKKVVFFNKAIKSENPFVINYERNLETISKTIDSSEIYTKMYVKPVASETIDAGYVSIANTTLNPLLDDFILNFDYMYEVGSINDLQKAEIENYKIRIHKINKKLIELEENYNELLVKLNDLEASKSTAEASLASAREQLLNYETLRDNEVTNVPVIRNKTNSYSLIMVPQVSYNIVQGTFKLNGINAATLKGWRNNKYGVNDGEYTDKFLFEAKDIINAQSPPSISDLCPDKWFLTYDEHGFPSTLFTSRENKIFKDETFGRTFDINTGAIIYLELEYCPKNKYEAICNKLYGVIAKEEANITNYINLIGEDTDKDTEKWTGLKKEIQDNNEEREKLYSLKEQLNFKLERVLGPALREGYWQPESYEDPGEGHNNLVSYNNQKDQETYFIFDEVLFEGEQKEYYYDDPLNITEEGKIYYNYIDLTEISDRIGKGEDKLSQFCITLTHPEYNWMIPNGVSLIQEGKYYFLLDGKFYVFYLDDQEYKTDYTSDPKQIDILTLYTKTNGDKQAPYITIKRSNNIDGSNSFVVKDYLPVEGPFGEISEVIEDGYNITNAFMGANQYLSSRNLYNNAGFVYAFLKFGENDYRAVALLQSEDIDYTRYHSISYSFDNNLTTENEAELIIEQNVNKFPIVYPRLFLNYRNVNIDSDNFSLKVTYDDKKLEKFEDYSSMLRKGRVYVTLKVTDNNIPWFILNEPYNIIYQVSRANEMLYLDAKEVAKENSKPKNSYEITIANLPEENSFIELGQLVYINDYNVDAIKEYGYVSEISYVLDTPSKDSIKISNYETKFEDLFSSISAQSEAMKQNQAAYNIAAASFTSKGEVQKEVLQQTLDNNNFAFNFSNTNIRLDDTGGLILTNTNSYNNGIQGQIALRGGGIFCSNSVDKNGDRIWTTGITPEGVNASLVTSGHLDTNSIHIYAGDTIAFQWNNEGLFAYKEMAEDGRPTLDENNFVRLNENGLTYVNNGMTQLELSWNGLIMQGADGHVRLTAKEGLRMFDDDDNVLVTFGRRNDVYGMFFTDVNGNVTLQTTQNGQLRLIDKIYVGSDMQTAGISGTGDYRFWAGTANPSQNSPFRVDAEGNVYAKNINSSSSVMLSTLSNNDLETTTLGATAIMADAFMYAPEIEADYFTAEEITTGDITIQNGSLVFQKGSTKAILSFDGEKLIVEYE